MTDAGRFNPLYIFVGNIKLYYERFCGRGIPTILLHGWGANCSVMRPIYDNFVQNGKSVIMLDFPLFGKSDNPPSDYTIYDYAKLTESFIVALELAKVNIIAHSFGGRVALILAQNDTIIDKLVITGGAGLKPKRKIGYYIKVFKFKLCKRLGIEMKNAGSVDYQTLDEKSRKIFVNVVNTHLDYTLDNIAVSVLLLWGRNDDQTPLYMANRMNKKIRNSALVVIENASHFAFLDASYEFNAVVNSFI